MDYIMWSYILFELALSVSGEREVDKLVKKAAAAFITAGFWKKSSKDLTHRGSCLYL